ncbi:hypothetical protein BT96DRAFT_1007298 [Gymnopus androsaceus JB14]|uniref:F-box domain-containing protein n=1 Tax=Gymnopus androsaceus JB14 TaxID=1447944 RepID=A0A6A4GIH1_9AGAR|nr:hypothetical protein BT96DRAFT_1007298 [Gymnopus androsaceus JB14]
MPQFPQEIFDLFIDQLADSPADLKALSLVAKSWPHRTRKHLFRRLHIAPLLSYSSSSSKNERDYADRMTILAEAFERLLHTPEIVHSIKVVTIGRYASGMFRLVKQERDSKGLLHGMASALNARLRVLTRNFGGPGTYKPTLNAHICALCALPSNHIESLSYDWVVDRFDSQSSLTDFSDILQSSRLRLKHLSLQNVNILPSSPAWLDLLGCITAYAPLLETLCLTVWGYTARLSDLEIATFRQNAQKPSTHGLIAPIAMSRFCLRNGFPSQILEILLFENRHLTFKNLVYLAIEHTSIPLFDRPSCLQNLKHLTLYESLR